MAALQSRRVQLLAMLYATFGEPATWTPADGGAAFAVTIRRTPEDDAAGFGSSEMLVRREFMRVRQAEVAAPAEGDQVAILDADTGQPTGEAFRICGEPRQARGRPEWILEPAPLHGF